MNLDPSVTYREAGVDIDAGEQLVERIKPHVRRTMRREVLGGIGGFGALVEVPLDRYRKPVLVSGTDGVGTKLRLAIDSGRPDTVGIDLVAMCANDVVVQGAEPLFFLDYYASGKLDVDVGERLIAGIVEGCVQAGCALVGGETAEMPGMYHGDDYDLAGFCVGIVEKDAIIDGTRDARRRRRDRLAVVRRALQRLFADSQIDRTQRRRSRHPYRGRRADRPTDGADADLRQAAARIAAPCAGPRPGAHHRGRPRRQYSASHPGRLGSSARARLVATANFVRLAATARQRGRCRDVSRVQLRHRHDRASRGG